MKENTTYRINGFDQIKAFYSWIFNNQDKNINSSHVSLYLFLINQNNRSNWVEWFKCPYDLGMAGSCIGSRNTYYKCLEDLREWKLIEYKKGINYYKAPLIKLYLLKNEQVTMPLSEQVTEQVTMPLTEPLTEHIYKLLTNNLKRITDNIIDVVKFLDDLEFNKSEINKISFEEFWSLYDKKVGDQSKIKKKWIALSNKEQELIIAHIPKYKTAQPDKKFRKNPETYLNNKAWNDELIPAGKNNSHAVLEVEKKRDYSTPQTL